MAADQRYCLNCGVRRGAPRVATTPTPGPEPAVPPAPPAAQRPADVSPLAAVIGIALLGGMLLIGVLIGRSGSSDEPAPAPIVQVGDPAQTTPTTTTPPITPEPAPGPAVTTDWPTDAEGFTIQLSTIAKDGATQDSVGVAKQTAASDGAPNVGVLDSDLYPGLPAASYIVYSGIFSGRKEAESALAKLAKAFPGAAVIQVKSGSKEATPELPTPDDEGTPTPGSSPAPDGASGGASVGPSPDDRAQDEPK